MDKSSVSKILSEIAVLLELQGENPFKSRAYSNAARTLDLLTDDLGVLVKEKRLGEIKGIGDALQEKITELVCTGKMSYYEKLKASIAPGLLDMLRIPGLGPKRIRAIHHQLGIRDLVALEAACQDQRIAGLAGFGEKTAANILAGIQQVRSFQNQHRYGDVIALAEDLVETLRRHPDVLRISIAGSLRRGKEVIKDLDLLASSSNPAPVMDAFVHLPGVLRITNHGETKSSILLEGGIPCDLRVVPDRQFAYALHHFTGSKEHNVLMRQLAIQQGRKMSEWGLFEVITKKSGMEEKEIPCRTEEEIFGALGMEFIPPELREGMGEIEAATAKKIPRLIEWTQLRGCFHNHTTASDGRSTLEEMAQAAIDLGLDYLGIADHSKSSFQANGLSAEQLEEQINAIHAFNKTHPEIHLFTGVECDILKNGELDFPDELLARLDYVVASVHSSFTQSEEEMTRRLIHAMENPHVTMLGHPTGRLLLEREGYAVHLPSILEAAAKTGTWIELNANPHRLDLDWRWWKAARDLGVRCVINPDAHHTSQLGFLKLGVQIARKGWLRAEDVINTFPLSKIKTALKKKLIK